MRALEGQLWDRHAEAAACWPPRPSNFVSAAHCAGPSTWRSAPCGSSWRLPEASGSLALRIPRDPRQSDRPDCGPWRRKPPPCFHSMEEQSGRSTMHGTNASSRRSALPTAAAVNWPATGGEFSHLEAPSKPPRMLPGTALLSTASAAGGKLARSKCQPSAAQGAGGLPSGRAIASCCCAPDTLEILPHLLGDLGGPSSGGPEQASGGCAAETLLEPHHPACARPLTRRPTCRCCCPNRSTLLSRP